MANFVVTFSESLCYVLLFSCANKNFLFDACQKETRLSNDCVLHLFPFPQTRRSHIINILLASFFSIDLWPKTRLIRGIYSNLSNTFPAVPRGAWHLSSESDISLIQEIASPHLHCGQILHPISYHPCEWQEIFRCELGWGFLFSCVVAVWMSSAFP